MNIVLRASVKNGELLYENPMAYHKLLVSISGLIEVVFRKPRSPRTNQMNRYYWLLMNILARSSQDRNKDEWHEDLKAKFLIENPDSHLPRVRSTTDLSIQEFSEYLQNIKRLVAEYYSIVLPEPNEIEV